MQRRAAHGYVGWPRAARSPLEPRGWNRIHCHESPTSGVSNSVSTNQALAKESGSGQPAADSGVHPACLEHEDLDKGPWKPHPIPASTPPPPYWTARRRVRQPKKGPVLSAVAVAGDPRVYCTSAVACAVGIYESSFCVCSGGLWAAAGAGEGEMRREPKKRPRQRDGASRLGLRPRRAHSRNVWRPRRLFSGGG